MAVSLEAVCKMTVSYNTVCSVASNGVCRAVAERAVGGGGVKVLQSP